MVNIKRLKNVICKILLQIGEFYSRKHGVNRNVVDPDPDLIGSGIFWSPGSGSGKIPDPDPLSTKRPHVIQIFLL